MKFLAIAAALVAVAACGPKGESVADGADSLGVKKEVVKKASELMPSKAQKDSVSYLIGYVFGGYIKGYNFGDDLNFGKIKAGIKDLLNAKNNPGTPEFEAEFEISPSELDRLFNDYLAKRFEYIKAKNAEDGERFIAKSLKKGYKQTATGLLYKINNLGEEPNIRLRDTVEVNYKGTFTDGKVFDQTTPERGAFKFIVAPNSVIEGWIEAVQLIGNGGSISIVVPSKLAYGEQGGRGMEPNRTLLFDIDVVSVKPFVAPVVAEQLVEEKK